MYRENDVSQAQQDLLTGSNKWKADGDSFSVIAISSFLWHIWRTTMTPWKQRLPSTWWGPCIVKPLSLLPGAGEEDQKVERLWEIRRPSDIICHTSTCQTSRLSRTAKAHGANFPGAMKEAAQKELESMEKEHEAPHLPPSKDLYRANSSGLCWLQLYADLEKNIGVPSLQVNRHGMTLLSALKTSNWKMARG